MNSAGFSTTRQSTPVRSRAERVGRWCRRKPALATLVVALNLVFGLGLAGVFWQWRRAERNATREASERAEQESLKVRQIAYASDMKLAHQAVQADELDRALELLDRHRPMERVESKSELSVERRTKAIDRRTSSSTLNPQPICAAEPPALSYEDQFYHWHYARGKTTVTRAQLPQDGQKFVSAIAFVVGHAA